VVFKTNVRADIAVILYMYNETKPDCFSNALFPLFIYLYLLYKNREIDIIINNNIILNVHTHTHTHTESAIARRKEYVCY